jgi:hypothetical protein
VSDKPTINHVERPAPPWRSAPGRTECGLPTAGHPVITRPEFEELVRRLGKQRAAMQLCMTCWNTAIRWADWATDPVQVVMRETQGGKVFRRETYGTRTDPSFRDELRALAALVEAHRDEFDGYLAGLDDAASLADARARRRRRGVQ